MRTSPVRWMRCNVVSADAPDAGAIMAAATIQIATSDPPIADIRFDFISIPLRCMMDDQARGVGRRAGNVGASVDRVIPMSWNTAMNAAYKAIFLFRLL